ncbi:hypothetical protein PENSPDRAFT_754087 [Peniophora sp. CONT]|nr:hypothetical protein PENSPDRAFT_754087 [Peniophora sp. CONT]
MSLRPRLHSRAPLNALRPPYGASRARLTRYNSSTSGSGSSVSSGSLVPYLIIGSIGGGTALAVKDKLDNWFKKPEPSAEAHSESAPTPAPATKEESGVKPYANADECKAAIEELRAALPGEGQVKTDPKLLQTYGHSDNSYHPDSPHAVIVRPTSTEDVVKIVNIARKYRMPVTPYSGATSLEGHYAGFSTGSICIDMGLMNKILEIHANDADLVCQPAAKWEDINAHLKEQGLPLFFPLDPGPGATIGGMIGTGCSGTNAVRYGTARAEWFLNLTVVLPSGEVIKTKQRARKSSTGFDTTKLFVGAEGTLGVVTEATLRLAPLLPTKVAMAQFNDVGHAVSAVQEILQSPYGSHVQCVELLDDNMMSAINGAGLLDDPLPVQDSLFFKLQGSPDTVAATAKTIQKIASAHGSQTFEFAKTDEEADALWMNRKYALNATLSSSPGSRCWTTDVCVPVSRLPELVYETKKDLAKAGIKSTIVGHVGDGNFHSLMLFQDESELPGINAASDRLVKRALALEGTCTGEHGVGVGKKKYLIKELGQSTVDLMWTIKNAVDPLNIMNPGKLYPDVEKKP